MSEPVIHKPHKRRKKRDPIVDILALLWSLFYFTFMFLQARDYLKLEPTEFATVTSIILFIVGFYFGKSRSDSNDS